MREGTGRRLRLAFRLGLWPGLALFTVLFLSGALSMTDHIADPDPDTARILEHYLPHIALTIARVLLAHLWTGLVLGGSIGLLLGILFPSLVKHRLAFLTSTAVLLGVFFGYCTARLLVHQPSFFDQFLLSQGPLAQHLQVWLTTHLEVPWLDAGLSLGLAALLLSSAAFRSMFRWKRPPPRSQVLFWLSIGTGVLTLGVRLFWSPQGPVRPDRPNILLLSIDSLRPDHLSCLGYGRPTTPHIDALARRSRVFEQAFVPVARTLPSWTSLLTSTSPHRHGIRHMFPRSSRRQIPLPTLAEVLAQNGYRSAVVSDFAGEMFDLIDYGFDRVDTPPASDVDVLIEHEILLHFPHLFPFVNHRLGKRVLPVISYLTINSDADALARSAVRRVRELADSGPFFLTVFFSTSHAPYAASAPYYSMFTDPEYDGPHRYAYGIRDPRQLRESHPALTPADEEQILALYDGAIASVDAAIGSILEQLEEWKFLDSTVVLVTADHGEHLFEGRNTLDHGKWFRDGDHANRIPLIVFDPSGKLGQGTVQRTVRSLDIMPTLLSLLGLPVPRSCEGEDLTPALLGEPGADLPVFAETGIWLKAPSTFEAEPDALVYPYINEVLDPDPRDDTLALRPVYEDRIVEAKHRMGYQHPYRLIYEPRRDGATWQLYDVRSDPLGQQPVQEDRPEEFAALRASLERWMREDPCRRMDPREHLLPYSTTLAPYRGPEGTR